MKRSSAWRYLWKSEDIRKKNNHHRALAGALSAGSQYSGAWN